MPRVPALPGGLLPITDTEFRHSRSVYTVLELIDRTLNLRNVSGSAVGYSLV